MPIFEHAKVLYWQRACSTYTFAPDAIVASSKGPGGMTAAPVPACWTSYEASAGNVAALGTPPTARGFTEALVFLHRRRSPGGTERVVAVRGLPLYLTSASVLQALQPVTVEQAELWPLTSRPTLHEAEFPGGFPVEADVQIFGGQPDPADPSRFTIRYTVNGSPGMIDGRLADDGTVSLVIRDGSTDVYEEWQETR